jgi:hypothetical protein
MSANSLRTVDQISSQISVIAVPSWEMVGPA